MSTAVVQPTREIETSADTFPEGWVSIDLGEHVYIAGRIGWRGLKADEYTSSGPILLSVHNLNYGDCVNFSTVHHISTARYEESPEIQLKIGDTLLVKDGAGIGKLAYVAKLPAASTVNSFLLVVRPSDALVSNQYLFQYLRGPQFQGIALQRITGSGTPHLFQRDIKQLRVLVPPVPEQKRIVGKLQDLSARVNSAFASTSRRTAAR
jgi:type I restriction enzyme S subunit